MKKNVEVVGIIPARGGSKGVPKKNIREIGGFPLIAYSIVLSQLVKKMDRCIVSTDCEEIATTAKRFGADVPFIRPSEIANDSSTDLEYMRHAIQWYDQNEGYIPEHWVILRPTTPLREPEVVDSAIDKIINTPEATSLISIHEFAETPGKMFGMQDGFLHGLCPMDPRPEYFTLPRQEFAPAFFGNGYVDIVKSTTVLDKKSCFGSRMLGFETPDTGEIDVLEDIQRVEYFLNKGNNSVHQRLTELS